jgi:hypothetical protein
MSGAQSSTQITEIKWNPVIDKQVYPSDLIIASHGHPFNETTALINAISFIKMARATPFVLGNKDARQHLYRIQAKCADGKFGVTVSLHPKCSEPTDNPLNTIYDGTSYKHGKGLFLSFAGAELCAKVSDSFSLAPMKNIEVALALVKEELSRVVHNHKKRAHADAFGEDTMQRDECKFSSFFVDATESSAMAAYGKPLPNGWESMEELTGFALREFVEHQAVEARLDHDDCAFYNEHQCLTWAPAREVGDSAIMPYTAPARYEMEKDHATTMDALWGKYASPFAQVEYGIDSSGDAGGSSGAAFEAIKKYEMQLLRFGADRDCAIIIKDRFIDAAALIAAASTTPKCRMTAANLIDQSGFDKRKLRYHIVHINERHLPLRFLTFSDAMALLAVLSADGTLLDPLASRMVMDVIRMRSGGDMSACIHIAPRSKIYNVLVSDTLLQLRKAIQASPHEVGTISFVYVTINPKAWEGDLKIGQTYDVARRVCSLNTACRHPYAAIAVAPTFDSKRDEKKVHRRLASSKCVGTRAREFFHTDESTAIDCLKEEVEAPFYAEFARRVQGL